MGRRALIIGIEEYEYADNLSACINDARTMKSVLERHSNNQEKEKNFDVELLTTDLGKITKNFLRDKIEELFKHDRDISLLYFSGHGFISNTDGYLVTSECARGDDGISMNEIITMANSSPASNRLIILDCCHAGKLGKTNLNNEITAISEGVTILGSSTVKQYSKATEESSIFTELLVHALDGGAANILGEVSAGNIYGYIDKAMGESSQRPIFITNVRRYFCIRKTFTQIKKNELREIVKLFHEGPDMEFKLDPSFELKSKKTDLENVLKFRILQMYNRVNLVVPVDAPHMYHAAMESKSCKLTPQGKSYWVMVSRDII